MPGRPARLQVIVKMSDRYIDSGSSIFSPIRNATVGLVGVRIRSTCSKAVLKILQDQRSHFQRLQVIRIVVAGAQSIGAQQDAPLHFLPESVHPRFSIHVGEPGLASLANPVSHPVVTRKVRAGFGCRNQVVGGNGMLGMGQADFVDSAAQPFIDLDALFEAGFHFRIQSRNEVLAGNADAHVLQRLVDVAQKRFHRYVGGGRIVRDQSRR